MGKESKSDAGELLLEGTFYKGTRHSDFVVKRKIFLFEDQLWTLHPDKPYNEYKSWCLDNECTLQPASVLQFAAIQKLIRPPKKWTAVAAFQGRGEPVELYCFRIVWPKHHAKLLLGFDNKQEAEKWHMQIGAQIKFVHER